MSPSPNRYHQTISRNLGVVLAIYLKDKPMGVIYSAPFDVSLSGQNIFQPDLLFVSNANKSILTQQGAKGAPDWIAEILSKNNAKFDTEIKREIYAKHGVSEYWIVDPDKKEIHLYDFKIQTEQAVRVVTQKEHFFSNQFPGLDISAEELFLEDKS